MSYTHRIVQPGYRKGTVISSSGDVLSPPENWDFLPSGDAAITRSVKSKGITWVVQVRKGKRTISKGIWAPKEHIIQSMKEVESKRSTPEYTQKRKRDLARKDEKHREYKLEFNTAVLTFLNFHAKFQAEAEMIAEKVTNHATPVGSGTVARTKRIPLSARAEAAVIAWMRHNTTAYDSMKIPRIKGMRRDIRRQLYKRSMSILKKYQCGDAIPDICPLQIALRNS